MQLYHRLIFVTNFVKNNVQHISFLLDFKMSSGGFAHEDPKLSRDFKVIFVLGPPGCGKGTICGVISPVRPFL